MFKRVRLWQEKCIDVGTLVCCQRKCKPEKHLWGEVCQFISRALKTLMFLDLSPFIKISRKNTSDKHLRVFTAALFKKGEKTWNKLTPNSTEMTELNLEYTYNEKLLSSLESKLSEYSWHQKYRINWNRRGYAAVTTSTLQSLRTTKNLLLAHIPHPNEIRQAGMGMLSL